MSFAWRKGSDEPGAALATLSKREDYPTERVARYRLACGHLMGYYDRDHKHPARKSSMFCDIDMKWSEVMERVK